MNSLRNIPKSLSKLHHNILPVMAKGSWITDISGYNYLDLTSGIGALSTGHSHPRIIESVKKELDNMVHIPQQIFKSHPSQLELNEKIISITHPNLNSVFYTNSGSESTDNAIKMARRYTNKTNIITMNRGFHGRTLGALSITSSNLNCKLQAQPLIPGIFFCENFTKESIDNLLSYQTSPKDTAAIILEPVQGEGGIFSISEEFIKYLRQICDENNILLISDEVQCGTMRTGEWWNMESKNVVPDIMTFGKGISSGFPLSGIIGNNKIMDCAPNFLGGTYGGNVICSKAASTTIDIIKEENLMDNTKQLGFFIKEELLKLNHIREVRQYGLMIGIEFNLSNNKIQDILEKLREEKILVLMCGNKNQYIRLLPALNIKKEEIIIFLDKLEKILINY